MNPPASLDFVAIDFETANRNPASVCQVGVVRVEGGEVVARDSWLVIPPTGADDFDSGNIRIHGIFPRDVRKKGIDWRESLSRLEAMRGDSALVAHNASFDQGVFESACFAIGAVPPKWRWEDTLVVARRHLNLPDYKLPTVAAHAGVARFKHHDAEADAAACAQIAIHIAQQIGARDVDDLWPRRRKTSSTMQTRFYDRASRAKVSELPQPAVNADERHPLFGEKVVVTGEVPGMERWDAFEAIAAAGGTPQKGMTLKTTTLVVAAHSRIPSNYDPSTGSGKERKAAEYTQRGNQITFLGYDEFREALDWNPQQTQVPSSKSKHEKDTVAAEKSRVSLPRTSAHEVKPPQEPAATPTPIPVEPAQKVDKEETRVSPALAPTYEVTPVKPAPENAHAGSTYDSTPRMGSRAPAHRTAPTPSPGSRMAAVPPPETTTHNGGSTVRKVIGWLLLIPGALVTLFTIVALIMVVVQPGELAVKIGAFIIVLLVGLVPAGLTFLGIYFIWLRDWRLSNRPLLSR